MDLHRPDATADIFCRVDMTSRISISRAVNALPWEIDMLCNLPGKRGSRDTSHSEYASGVRILSEEALPLISSGGSIVIIAPLPEVFGERPPGRGIRLRYLDRRRRDAAILPQLIEELSTASQTCLLDYG
jgi:hypothetical protein